MGRITFKDLPRDKKISPEEMKKVYGGIFIENIPSPKISRSPLFGTQFLGSRVGWDPGDKGF